MPSIVGNIKINSIVTSGTLNVGDTFYLSPKKSSKTFTGSGSSNTGDFQQFNNGINATTTMDNDLIDDTDFMTS